MEIVFVDRPLQDELTTNKQVIDGKTPHWCVGSESLKIGESFQEWMVRKREYWEGVEIKRMYLYDIEAQTIPTIGEPPTSTMIVRYAITTEI